MKEFLQLEVAVFSVITPCSDVAGCHYFRWPCSFLKMESARSSKNGILSQYSVTILKTATWIFMSWKPQISHFF